MIDLITGHQGFAHITAEQVANVNNAMTSGYGTDCVLRLIDGLVTSTGLSIGVGTGYWRANGFDMEITAPETIYIDPSSVGTSRIDNFYVEILQDIASGNQRSELVYVKGTEASVPTPPADPTAPQLTTDIMLQCVQFAAMTVSENTATLTDLTKEIGQVSPEEMSLVKAWIRDNADVYSSLVPHYRGEVVLNALDGKIYECIKYCSASTWEINQNKFVEKSIVSILSELGVRTSNAHKYGNCITAAATTAKTVSSAHGDMVLDNGAVIYVKFQYSNTASSPTLNVDDTGAKSIKGYSSTNPSIWWKAGDIVEFVYDGSYWVMLPTQGQVSDLNEALSNLFLVKKHNVGFTSVPKSSGTSKVESLTEFGYELLGVVGCFQNFSNGIVVTSGVNTDPNHADYGKVQTRVYNIGAIDLSNVIVSINLLWKKV